MDRRITTEAYLASEETNRPHELVYGLLREPAAPGFDHQIVVGAIFSRLERHVRRMNVGRVVVSPVDVVLDRENALVVQPDIVYVSPERLSFCAQQIWGPPDLVVEVLSSGNLRRDRTVKVAWYRQYGVRECWLVDPIVRVIDVLDLAGHRPSATFEEGQMLRSTVLPRLRFRVKLDA
jgi:Uma2 family endonuclease